MALWAIAAARITTSDELRPCRIRIPSDADHSFAGTGDQLTFVLSTERIPFRGSVTLQTYMGSLALLGMTWS